MYNNSDSYFCEYEIKVISGYKMLLLLIITGKPIFKGLNIHHKYYIFGHNPWEYKDDALITLCEDCHRKRHESQNIPVYNENRDIIEYAKVCDRCHGSGYLPEYYHVQQGICFKCGGEGVVIKV